MSDLEAGIVIFSVFFPNIYVGFCYWRKFMAIDKKVQRIFADENPSQRSFFIYGFLFGLRRNRIQNPRLERIHKKRYTAQIKVVVLSFFFSVLLFSGALIILQVF